MRWLELAWTDLGQTEIEGPKSNPVIAGYFRDAEHPEVESDEVAWCAAFVGAHLQRAGHKPTGSLMARSYLTWGRKLEAPQKGAVCILPRGNDPASGHVGFVVGWTDTTVSLLGGNQGNRVSVQEFQREQVLAYRWPGTTAEAAAANAAAAPAIETGQPARSWLQVIFESRTIKGSLYGALGSLVVLMEGIVSFGLETARTVTGWQPLQEVLALAGGNVKSIGAGLVAWGVTLTILRRLKDEPQRPPEAPHDSA
jgi:uncharacterized protein (TIGR02594 family)